MTRHFLLHGFRTTIKTGDPVVALMDNGDVLGRIFVERDDNFMLVSMVNDESHNITIPKRGPQGIRGMLRVIQSIRNEIPQRNGKETKDEQFWKKYLPDGGNKEDKL